MTDYANCVNCGNSYEYGVEEYCDDCATLPNCPAGGKCEGDCEPGCRVEESHFHDCGFWVGEPCNCAERSVVNYAQDLEGRIHTGLLDEPDWVGLKTYFTDKYSHLDDDAVDPYYYSCGANYCDDPACIMNRPDHPEHFGPHPEVL